MEMPIVKNLCKDLKKICTKVNLSLIPFLHELTYALINTFSPPWNYVWFCMGNKNNGKHLCGIILYARHISKGFPDSLFNPYNNNIR